MVDYPIMDSYGRIIVLQEKTSILITLAVALTAIGAIILFGLSIFVLSSSTYLGLSYGFAGLLLLVYVFALNHLRKKADMNIDRAFFPSPYGGTIEVRKVSSIWITLAMVFTIIMIGSSIVSMFYSVSLPGSMSSGFSGLGGIIMGIVALFVLNFLRTELDFPGDKVVLRSTTGVMIELYKDSSILITIAMVFTLLGAFILMGLGVYTIALSPSSAGLIAGGYFVLLGIFLLIISAVLNFLRVRTHLREIGYQQPQPPMTGPPRPIY